MLKPGLPARLIPMPSQGVCGGEDRVSQRPDRYRQTGGRGACAWPASRVCGTDDWSGGSSRLSGGQFVRKGIFTERPTGPPRHAGAASRLTPTPAANRGSPFWPSAPATHAASCAGCRQLWANVSVCWTSVCPSFLCREGPGGANPRGRGLADIFVRPLRPLDTAPSPFPLCTPWTLAPGEVRREAEGWGRARGRAAVGTARRRGPGGTPGRGGQAPPPWSTNRPRRQRGRCRRGVVPRVGRHAPT